MSPKGYTTNDLVAEELGVTFTGDQEAQCYGLIEEAEAFIDRATSRAWIVTSPATERLAVPAGGVVYLKNRPVTTITSVSVRSTAIGADSTALVEDTGYELIDPTNGVLLLAGYGANRWPTDPIPTGYLATVTYTHTNAAAALPGDLRRATTLLVAAWMGGRIQATAMGGSTTGIKSYSVGGELSVAFADGAGTGTRPVPDLVASILASYRGLVFA